jgi:hypothetical protein
VLGSNDKSLLSNCGNWSSPRIDICKIHKPDAGEWRFLLGDVKKTSDIRRIWSADEWLSRCGPPEKWK